ncbi:hypothetical protein [Candidatus Lokiarchaeum ossiferum]|uniref:hypothetical protein n=1 Tax=Candidatus Lokiarchaeum ossiferum TaxID=2951803 RepID=UPI00352FAD32
MHNQDLIINPEQYQAVLDQMGFKDFAKNLMENVEFQKFIDPIKQIFSKERELEKLDNILRNQKLIAKGMNELDIRIKAIYKKTDSIEKLIKKGK